MSVPDPSTRYRRRTAVSASQVGSRQVLFHSGTGTSLVLNPAGSLIWGWLAEPQTAAELGHHLATTYDDLSDEQAREDVAAYLEELASDGVIEVDVD